MNQRKNFNHSDSEQITCARCGATRVQTRFELDAFNYRHGDASVELRARVPIRACLNCGFEFTDAAAEDARHEAVCRYLGVLAPGEIAAIRQRYGLSRAEFARLTRIGEASLSRWEGGLVIQNGSIDQLLYLMTFPENMERLRHRASGEPSVKPVEMEVARGQAAEDEAETKRLPRLRALQVTSEVLTAAKTFELVRSAA